MANQYKECSDYNQEQLKNAKNLEELIQIKVAKLGKTNQNLMAIAGLPQQPNNTEYFNGLSMSIGGKDYNPQYDPLFQSSQIPAMVNRKFLVNQAILSNSNNIKRNFGQTSKSSRPKGSASLNKTSRHDQNVKIINGQKEYDELLSFQQIEEAETRKTDGVTDEDVLSANDPIKTLKAIFQQTTFKTGPLEINPIMKKYRKEKRKTKAFNSMQDTNSIISAYPNLDQMMTESGGGNRNIFSGGGKTYKEDYFEQVKPSKFSVFTPPANNQITRVHSSNRNGNQTNINEQVQGNQEYSQDQFQPEQGINVLKDYIYEQKSTSQALGQSIQEKLENLKRIFEQEEIANAVKDIERKWKEEEEEQEFANKYQKPSLPANMFAKSSSSAIASKVSDHDTKKFLAQAIDPINDDNIPINDLRKYLAEKIRDAQQRLNANMMLNSVLPNHEKDIQSEFPDEQRRFTFKASTLTHIAELRALGQDRIENQLIERLFRENTDYHYEKYNYQKKQIYAKDAVEFKQNSQIKNLKSQFDEKLAKWKFKEPKRTKNFVQEQIMKLDKLGKQKKSENSPQNLANYSDHMTPVISSSQVLKVKKSQQEKDPARGSSQTYQLVNASKSEYQDGSSVLTQFANNQTRIMRTSAGVIRTQLQAMEISDPREEQLSTQRPFLLHGSDSRNNNENVAMTAMIESRESPKQDADSPVIRSSSFEKLINVSKSAVVDLNKSLVNVQDLQDDTIIRSKEENSRVGTILQANDKKYSEFSDGLTSKKRDGKFIPTLLNKHDLKVLQSNSGNLMNNLFKSSREKDLLTNDNNLLSPIQKIDNELSMTNNPMIFPIQQNKPTYILQENTNIKINKNKQNYQGLNLMKLQIPDGDIRVSEMIRDYNAIYGYQPDSPQENLHYQTDSEVYTQTRNAFFKRQSLDSRGAGFKRRAMEPNEILFREIEKQKRRQRSAERKSRGLRAKMLLLAKNQQLPLQQLKVFSGMDLEQTLNLTAGNYHTYFCAKRFNRFPRFTIFFKRDNLGNPKQQRSQSNETIVSLTPQFLQFLMEKQGSSEASKYFSNEISFTQKQPPETNNQNQIESVMSSLMMTNLRSKSPDTLAKLNNKKYGSSAISTKILHSLAHHSKVNQDVQDHNKSKQHSPIKIATAESKDLSAKKATSPQNQEKPSKQATYQNSGLGLLPIDEASKLWQQSQSQNQPQRVKNSPSTAMISSQLPSNQQLVSRPNMQNYDPFERVALVKGIDNQILTSFRTLKRENNIVSDTFKIVHQKFQPLQNKGLFFLQQNRIKGDRFTMYPLTDNEDAMDFAEAQLYAQSLADQNNTVEANRSNSYDDQRPSLEQNRGMILQARVKYEKKREKLKVPPIDTKNSPIHLQSLLEGVNQETKESERKVSKYMKIHQQLKQEQTDHSTKNEDVIDLSRLDDKLDDVKSSANTKMTNKIMSQKTGSMKSKRNDKKTDHSKYSIRQPVYKLDPNYQMESRNYAQNQKNDIIQTDFGKTRQSKAAVTMISMPGEIMAGAMSSKMDSRQVIDDPNGSQNNIKPFSRESQRQDLEARDGISALSGKSPQQIEVMVLSKVDPVDMAFPDHATGSIGSSGGLYQSKLASQNFIYGPQKVSGSLAQLTNTTVKNLVNQKNFAQNANRGSQSPFAKGIIQGGGNIQASRMNDTQIAAQISVTSSQTNDLRSQISPHILQNQGSIISDGRFGPKVTQIDERTTLVNPSFIMNYHVSLPDSNYGTQVRQTNADQDEVPEAPKTRFKITTNIQVTLDKDKPKRNAKTSKANLGGAIHKAEQVNIKKKDEPKYGKDFKIPELPPLLAAQLQDGQYQQIKIQNITPTSFQTNKGYNIKKFIDEIYQKEAKSRYHRQYVREDFLMTTSPIFDLSKFHSLKTRGDVLEEVAGAKTRFGGVNDTSKEKIYGLDQKGQLVMHRESQSLTNVLGFQAGGNHVILPYTLPKISKQQNDYNLTINGESEKGSYPQFIGQKSQSQFHPVQGYNHQPFYLNNIMIGSQKMNNAKGSTTLLESIAGGTSDGLTTMPYERGFVTGKDTQFQSNKKSKVRLSDDQRIISTVSELNKRQSEIVGFMNEADSLGIMASPGSLATNEINPQAQMKTKPQLI